MKKSLRIVLLAALLASAAPITLADSAPGGGMPVPMPSGSSFSVSFSVAVATILSVLGL
ncbi:MAG: hypothetical protein ABSC48_01630 [Terracidiphilus sp.]|jgi:hypothetical protein